MSYEEYINIINTLKIKNDLNEREKLLKSEINESLIPMVEPKLIDLIKTKYQELVNKMISNLEYIFSNYYNLDQYLVNFKKEVLFIYGLTDVKVLTDEKRKLMKKMIIDETKKTYEILINKANLIDISGVLSITIKNNEIKWGDLNEL